MSETISRRRGLAATLAPTLAAVALVAAYTATAIAYMAPAPLPRNAAAICEIRVECRWLVSVSVVLALSSAVLAVIGRGGGKRRLVLAWLILGAWWLLAFGVMRYALGLE
jgi:hypothetical protein